MVPAMARDIETVGIIGVGRMGREMGRYLLRAGRKVVAHDPMPDGPEALRAAGGTVAGSIAEVGAASDLILVIVVDDAQVEEVVAGPGGLFTTGRDGSVIAVCASISPETCRSLEERGREVGMHVIDAALVGGERGAEAGQLLLLCGGDEQAIAAATPAMDPFSRAVIRVGDSGAGMVGKIVNNLLLWSCLRADYEALLLGRALGVTPAALREALAVEGSGANRPLAEWGEHRLRWPHKDLEQAMEIAAAAGVDMPFIAQLPALMETLTRDDLHDLL